MNFLKSCLVLSLGLSLTASAWAAAAKAPTQDHGQDPGQDPGALLVSKITQGKALITQEFKANDDLTGYVLTPAAGGLSMIVYTDHQGKYMLLGNIIDSTGQNLSAEYTDKYVTSVTAKAALQDSAKAHWFVDGKDSAPHQVYIAVDPNCIYCHLLYQEVFPLIDSGELQVRWIPVGFLKQTSPGKSAALLNAKDSATADSLLRQDELKFDAKQEEGGIKALDKSDKGADLAFTQVSENTAFFNKYGFQGTPTLIYTDKKSGKPAYYPGYLGEQAFKDLVNTMGKAW